MCPSALPSKAIIDNFQRYHCNLKRRLITWRGDSMHHDWVFREIAGPAMVAEDIRRRKVSFCVHMCCCLDELLPTLTTLSCTHLARPVSYADAYPLACDLGSVCFLQALDWDCCSLWFGGHCCMLQVCHLKWEQVVKPKRLGSVKPLMN